MKKIILFSFVFLLSLFGLFFTSKTVQATDLIQITWNQPFPGTEVETVCFCEGHFTVSGTVTVETCDNQQPGEIPFNVSMGPTENGPWSLVSTFNVPFDPSGPRNFQETVSLPPIAPVGPRYIKLYASIIICDKPPFNFNCWTETEMVIRNIIILNNCVCPPGFADIRDGICVKGTMPTPNIYTSDCPGYVTQDGICIKGTTTTVYCGNNIKEGSEQCDGTATGTACDGNCNPAGSVNECKCPICGNSVKEGNEQCDSGTFPGVINQSGCTNNTFCKTGCQCVAPVCGNNIKEGNEQCDGTATGTLCDGNCIPAGSTNECKCPVCGNAIVEPPKEECEPPNIITGFPGSGCGGHPERCGSLDTIGLWTTKTESVWGSGSSNPWDPYNTYYHDSRAQFIILASELSDLGFKNGDKITSVSLKTYQQPGRANLKNFRIRMKLTTATATTSWEGGWTDLFGPADILKADLIVGQWKEYTLSAGGFNWNGTSNIMVDISRDDAAYTSGGGMYKRDSVGTNRMFAGYCDSCTSGGLSLYQQTSGALGAGAVYNYAPSIKITRATAASCKCTPPGANNLSTAQECCVGVAGQGQVAFQWDYAGFNPQTRFYFQVDDNSDFTSPVVDRSIDFSSNPNTQALTVATSPATGELGYNKTYYWRVKVRDNAGLESNWITGQPFTTALHAWPYSAFTPSLPPYTPNKEITFIDTSECYKTNDTSVYPCSSIADATYAWLFGDGAICDSSTMGNVCKGTVKHTYSGVGNYSASLEVCDSLGCCPPISHDIQVVLPGQRLEWKEVAP